MDSCSKVCRACLSTKKTFTYYLFQNVPGDLFCFCISVEISQDDHLPKSLCDSCFKLLTKFSEFKNHCIQSQVALKSFATPSKSGVAKDINLKLPSDLTYRENDILLEQFDIKAEFDDQDDHPEYPLENIPEDENKRKSCRRKRTKTVKLSKPKNEKTRSKRIYCFSCEICNKRFVGIDRYEGHKLMHQGITNITIKCDPCNKTFATWSGLYRHKDSQHTTIDLDSLRCRTCGKVSKNRPALKMHELIHRDRQLTICDVCGRGFGSKIILKRHLETHNENRVKSHGCTECGTKFMNQASLAKHIARVHKGLRFICNICNYPFTDKHNLGKHLLNHEGKKSHKCELCDKSYGTISSLIEHRRIHSGEKPFSCTVCPKRFISKRRLVEHLRIHSGEKPYKCVVCLQGFSQRGTLKRHLRVHSKAPPQMQVNVDLRESQQLSLHC